MTTIALLSDIHMRETYRAEITNVLGAVRERLAAHDPAHTFVLGDLIEGGSGAETAREHVRTVGSILDVGPSPVTYLPGNHDVGALSPTELGDILAQDRFYGTVTLDDQPFVYLDSTVEGARARGALGADQRAWLRESVPAGAIVLVHHPVGQFSLADSEWFREFPERAYLWDRKELLELIGTRALATISGHVHRTAYTWFRGLSHVSINAVSKESPNEPVSGTYAILSLGGQPRVTVYRRDTTVASFPLTARRDDTLSRPDPVH